MNMQTATEVFATESASTEHLTETEKLLRANIAQAWQGIFKQDTAMAMSFAQKASIIYPDSPDVSHVLGVLASRDGRSDLALPLLQKALNGGVTERRLRDMAEALLMAHQPQAALAAITDAITQFGESTDSLGLLSAIQVALEDFIGAKASAKSAIALKPHLMAWDSNLGFCELITQQVVSGFKALTGRAENLQAGSRAPVLQFAAPCEIWIKNEQGPGDTIFNLRYAPALVEKGFKLHIQTDKKTKVLLRDTGLFASVKEDFTCPANAFWLNVGDLPLAALQLTGQEVAPPLALVPDASRVQKLRDKLAKIGPAPYIAVTWRAGPRGKKMRNGLRMFSKNMQAHDLGQALSKINATVISVQRIPEADENLAFKQGLGSDFVDFSVLNDQLQDMLALLSIVDQYVAVPNTNVHLRESLGLCSEVFVNRPFQDWRWLAEGDASPWYPNAYVYRQPKSGDWSESLVLLQQRLSQQFLQQAVKAPATLNVAAAQALVTEALLEQTSDDALNGHLKAGWLAVNNADITEAIKVAQSVLKLRNEYPPALHLLGWAAYRDGKAELAQGVLQRALELAPINGKIAGDFIRVLTANKQTALALKFATSAIEDADMQEKAAIYYARAATHTQLNQYQEALADYDACLVLSPNSLDALCYSGMVRLKLGDANTGFKYYSARPESRLPSRSEGHVCPWLRGDLTGLKLLVKRDMGLGDELTYLRYLPWLSKAGVQVDYWAGNKLVPMLTRLGYANHVLSDQTPLPNTDNYDLTIWVHELPVAAEALSAPEIAPPLPLTPRTDLVEKWQAWLTSCGPAPYIGLNWRAGAAAKGTAKAFSKLAKAIDDTSFANMLAPVNATFISLQRNVMMEELNAFKATLGAPLHDASALTDDIEDLLALLSILDENVGVSNTNMHLRAGLGLGSKVLVQSPGGDWRWGYEGNQSVWFSQSKVYRQSLSGDWANALQTVQDDLVEKYGVAQKVANSHVIEYVQKVTSKRCIWLTAGQIKESPTGKTSDMASTRYRVLMPMQALQTNGWQCEVVNEGLSQIMGGWGNAVPKAGDVLVVSKVFTEHAVTLVKDAKARGAIVIADFCDDFLNHPKRGALQLDLIALADNIAVIDTDMQSNFLNKGIYVNAVIESYSDSLTQAEQDALADKWLNFLTSNLNSVNALSTKNFSRLSDASNLATDVSHLRVLVGILYSGENEYEQVLAALTTQKHKNFQHFVIQDKPNKEAHDLLYASFMEQAENFDYFLKLDADMVLSSPDALGEMLSEFKKNQLAHLFAYVKDCPSNIMIPGIQMFKSDTKWLGSDEQLNVDYPPKIMGKSKSYVENNWILHMPNPSEYQLFRYGIHKALKSLQPDRTEKNIKKGILHLSILNGMARNVSSNQALWFALMGATLVYQKAFNVNEYNGELTQKLFNKIKNSAQKHQQLKLAANEFWINEIQVNYWWIDNFSSFKH